MYRQVYTLDSYASGKAQHNRIFVLARPCHKSTHYDMYALANYYHLWVRLWITKNNLK